MRIGTDVLDLAPVRAFVIDLQSPKMTQEYN